MLHEYTMPHCSVLLDVIAGQPLLHRLAIDKLYPDPCSTGASGTSPRERLISANSVSKNASVICIDLQARSARLCRVCDSAEHRVCLMPARSP